MDGGIFSSPKNVAITKAITEIQAKFDIKYQGTLDDQIGINIESLPDGKINIVSGTNVQRDALKDIVRELICIWMVLSMMALLAQGSHPAQFFYKVRLLNIDLTVGEGLNVDANLVI